jgi:hypothetical protein
MQQTTDFGEFVFGGQIVIKVFLAVWKKLDPLRERNTFEVRLMCS